MGQTFRILSIDGGGIRGIFPAKVLTDIEADLEARSIEKKRIHEHFDLICGTSTGGIIAIALALGIPAKDILNLYLENAEVIFGNKKNFLKRIFTSAHDRQPLEALIRKAFIGNLKEDPRLADCKTNICVPIYDLVQGKPSVLKTKHHDLYVRDFHIPAYQAALATSAAPTYFEPFSSSYTDRFGQEQKFSNKVDGGVVMNNPTLVGIIEAQKALGVKLEDLRVLSIGTGTKKYCDAGQRKHWGIYYWMLQNDRKRLIDLFMQGQSQQVENLISILHKGIGKTESDNFIYHRIDTSLDETCDIELDEVRRNRLDILVEKAHSEFQNHVSSIRSSFIDMDS